MSTSSWFRGGCAASLSRRGCLFDEDVDSSSSSCFRFVSCGGSWGPIDDILVPYFPLEGLMVLKEVNELGELELVASSETMSYWRRKGFARRV